MIDNENKCQRTTSGLAQRRREVQTLKGSAGKPPLRQAAIPLSAMLDGAATDCKFVERQFIQRQCQTNNHLTKSATLEN